MALTEAGLKTTPLVDLALASFQRAVRCPYINRPQPPFLREHVWEILQWPKHLTWVREWMLKTWRRLTMALMTLFKWENMFIAYPLKEPIGVLAAPTMTTSWPTEVEYLLALGMRRDLATDILSTYYFNVWILFFFCQLTSARRLGKNNLLLNVVLELWQSSNIGINLNYKHH